MGRITQVFKTVVVRRPLRMFADDNVFDHHRALGRTYPHHFAQHAWRVLKVVKRQATDDHVKLPVRKRQA